MNDQYQVKWDLQRLYINEGFHYSFETVKGTILIGCDPVTTFCSWNKCNSSVMLKYMFDAMSFVYVMSL